MTRQEMNAVCDILKYIQKRPRVKHTAEGIARYWIFQQRLEEKFETVMVAIEFLVKRGILEEVEKADGNSYYRTNHNKTLEIPVVLAKLQKAKENASNKGSL
jgi:Fe2+ or Zn2+ uptake regulation protein